MPHRLLVGSDRADTLRSIRRLPLIAGGAAIAFGAAVLVSYAFAIGRVLPLPQFLLPTQPWLSIIVIALDVLVIYAIIVHGREMAARTD